MYLCFFAIFSCCTELRPIIEFSVQSDPHFYALLCTAVGVHPSTGSFWNIWAVIKRELTYKH